MPYAIALEPQEQPHCWRMCMPLDCSAAGAMGGSELRDAGSLRAAARCLLMQWSVPVQLGLL